MRINEYTSLTEFITEYDNLPSTDVCRRFIGLEFIYNKVYYRLCNEPCPKEALPTLPNGEKGHYALYIVHWKNGFGSSFTYELVGWYSTIEDLLGNCFLQGKPFKEIIVDPSTELVGKD